MVNLKAIIHTEKDFKRFMDVGKHVKKNDALSNMVL